MFYVYIMESIRYPILRYIGFTGNKLDLRLKQHNEGTTTSTARYRPWRLIWTGAFQDKQMALAFETYLKSGSGRAFASKRLIPHAPS